jgi:hypothetical protein
MQLLLIHSPFLGPSTWSALTSSLERHGCNAHAPDLRGALGAGSGTYEQIARQVTALVTDGTVLVVHSGAGALAPSILDAAQREIAGVVFIDALMPHPGRSWFDTVPSTTADQIRRNAPDGFAPSWPSWLPPGLLEQLLPNATTRAALADEAPPVPLAYLSAPAPVLANWRDAFGFAYLQLSEAYTEEAKEAVESGWPTERLAGHHLSLMTEPEIVAASLLRLAAQLAD